MLSSETNSHLIAAIMTIAVACGGTVLAGTPPPPAGEGPGGGEYEVLWSAITTGGGLATDAGAQLTVDGVIGEPATGSSSAGPFELTAGYTAGVRAAFDSGLFADGFETGDTSAWSTTP